MVYGVTTGIGKLADGSTGEVVYTTDGGRVQEFGVWPTPTFIRQFGVGLLNQPRKLAVDPATRDLFVVSARDQHIVVFNPSGTMIGQFGSTGSGNGQFLNDPRGITISSDGIVFVSDSGNKRVEAFSSTGPGYNYMYQFGSGELVDERGLIATPDGKVAVTDEWGYGLKEYDYTSSGATLSRSLYGNSPPAPGFDSPRGIDIDQSTGDVYVVDWWNQRIEKFDQNGNFLLAWGMRGPKSVPGSINFAWDLAVRPSNGNIYLANRESHEIEVFNSSGNYLLRWGARGKSASNQFLFPQGITFDPTTAPASLLIADSGNGRVIRYSGFTGMGKGLNESLFGGAGSGAGQFKMPTGISVAPTSGNIWIADTQNNRVQRCTPDGSTCTVFTQPVSGTPFKVPWGVSVGPDGNIWVADSGNDRIVEMAPDGTQLFSASAAALGLPSLNGPSQIAFGPSGTIYVSVVWDNEVIELAQ
jgi:DNA-binding beta-propeller fold protein YncE